MMPIAFLHAGGHLAAVLSMSAGAVSFTHIIKASEPVASTAIGPFFGVEMQVRIPVTRHAARPNLDDNIPPTFLCTHFGELRRTRGMREEI